MGHLSCFKAYDIRGRVDDNLTEDLAFALGQAVATTLGADTVVVGRDIREASPRLLEALAGGLTRRGVDVIDLGLCGTEEVYFGTEHFAASAGIMVTASHNPIDYNGFKLVGQGAAPLDDPTFRAIEGATAKGGGGAVGARGKSRSANARDAYVARITSFADPNAIAPLHLLANSGNGASGPTFDAVLNGLTAAGARLTATRMHHTPDPTFPNGIPNPLLTENQPGTAAAVLEAGADMGIAWDGDFDRCFFFDHEGSFVPGEYIVGALAAAVLAQEPGASIVHDPRVIWNTRRIVTEAGGGAVVSKTGHALVKAKMREVNAAYGGEMSAHHYFRNFMYCDSGMIPWVLMLARLSATETSLKQVIDDMRERHPSSGEINFRVEDAAAVTRTVRTHFEADAKEVDTLDGLSMEFDTWRLNLRSSNTEPLLRLNVETLGDPNLLAERTDEISALIRG
ncbi:MAG: phosphomannomutase [Pseudomonadota bacterium]